MADVRLDAMLREFASHRTFRSDAPTVAALLDELERECPRLRFKIRDETGSLRKFVRVFVDGEDVSVGAGVNAPLTGARTVDILHSIAGG
jgi:molybdopterin synthase sulfur carrier subunit